MISAIIMASGFSRRMGKNKLLMKYNDKFLIEYTLDTISSESIKLGIKNCDKSEGYMFFVSDQPLLDKNDIEKLIKEFEKDKSFIIIPKYKESFGNPVIYPKKYKEQILNLEGDKGGKSIIKSSDKIKYVNVCENTLFDIDNINDFNNLIKRETKYE